VLAVSQMLGVGATTRVSHAAGRKDHEQAMFLFNQAQALSVAAGFVFFVLAMGWQFVMVAMGAALRGTGNFKPGMIVQTGTVILNMVLAPFLIFGWGTGYPLGVRGAALATFISIVVGIVWFMAYFPKGAYLEFHREYMKPQFPVWGKLLQIGLPAGAEFALMWVYLLVVYSVVRPFGSEAQAGFGIGMRIIQAAFMPVVALGFAVAPVA